MQVTSGWLEVKRACSGGCNWFKSHFPNGGDIESVLVLITQDDTANDSWVAWLMGRAKYTGMGWMEGLEIFGSLDLRDTGITALPDGLTVGGSLYLSGTGITALPDGLTVGGSLDLSVTGITALPDGLTVGGSLYLSGSKVKISDVPEHLKSRVLL